MSPIKSIALLAVLATTTLLLGCPQPSSAPPPNSKVMQSPGDLPPDSPRLAETLAKAGRLSTNGTPIDNTTFPYPVEAGKKSPDGYPIYAIECSDLTKVCTGPTGEALGAIDVVAKQLTPIRNADVLNPQYHCALICTDNRGNLVGAVSPEMLQYLSAQKAAATNVVPPQQ